MNTFLLKMGCLFLFGFIFFQSFQTELNADSSSLIGQQEQIEFIKQKTDVITVDATYSSVVNYETADDYLEQFIEK